MCPISEADGRVIRGRQIVARQQELVAKFGERLPAALELLKVYERTLAVLEESLAACQLRYDDAAKNACVEQADAIDSVSEREEQMREIAHLMEILREGGFHCELSRDITLN